MTLSGSFDIGLTLALVLLAAYSIGHFISRHRVRRFGGRSPS